MNGRVFSRADELAAGKSGYDIDRLLDQQRWLRLRSGIYCTSSAYASAADERAQHRFLVAAALQCLVAPAVASMWSAALLHGLPVPRARDRDVCVTREVSRPRRYPHLRVRVAGLPPDHVTRVDGVPVTTAARTVVDLARRLPFIDAVVVADASLYLRCTTRDELLAVLDRCRQWPGVNRARDVVAFADGGAESPLESRSRVRLVHELGLPPPELNVWIPDAEGRPLARVDMLWRRHRTIGEADGAVRYGEDEPASLFLEKIREDTLRGLRYEVVRWTWWDVEKTPRGVVGWVERAFARGAAP
ncbi:MAG: hypothetical protein J2P24_04910 [Streptosporangiales bacterium]|nr:hypothetical protein [Streptosporangiales bacterium]